MSFPRTSWRTTPLGITEKPPNQRATLIEMPHPEENYLVEKLCRLLESGKDQEYILKKYGTSSDVIQALIDAEDFVKL